MSTTETVVERSSDSESPSMAVVAAVSKAVDADPTKIEPLYATIDPDALDQFVQSTGRHGAQSIDKVQFTMEGCTVVVHGSGRVTVTPPEAAEHDARVEDSD